MISTTIRYLSLCGVFCLVACGGKTESLVESLSPPSDAHPSTSGFPSCRLPRAGADHRCGAQADLDCCDSLAVPGGTFLRDNNPEAPATLSPFRLDRFEVTVGRFRAFVEAYPESRPRPGDGTHPKIPGSGWRKQWDAYLPINQDGLREYLVFIEESTIQPGYTREDLAWLIPWTNEPETKENLPMGNLSWPLAFAFCIWDGGRLPTEAEWSFAALGGEQQRKHPWGDAPVDDEHSANWGNVLKEKRLRPVGSALAGVARWGHLDLNGSHNEHVLDAVSKYDFYANPCHDCALLDPPPELGDFRRFKDHGNPDKRAAHPISSNGTLLGVRCARD